MQPLAFCSAQQGKPCWCSEHHGSCRLTSRPPAQRWSRSLHCLLHCLPLLHVHVLLPQPCAPWHHPEPRGGQTMKHMQVDRRVSSLILLSLQDLYNLSGLFMGLLWISGISLSRDMGEGRYFSQLISNLKPGLSLKQKLGSCSELVCPPLRQNKGSHPGACNITKGFFNT